MAACLDSLRECDTLVIRVLDRIVGTEQMAIELIRDLGRRDVRLRCLAEPFLDVDTGLKRYGSPGPMREDA